MLNRNGARYFTDRERDADVNFGSITTENDAAMSSSSESEASDAAGATEHEALLPTESYTNVYGELPDLCDGEYQPLFQRVAPGVLSTTILRYFGQADRNLPKVFLALVSRNGAPTIVVLHRLTVYAEGLHPTPHDGKTFAILGEVQPGRHVDLVELTASHFAEARPARVRTPDETDVAASIVADTTRQLPPIEDDERGEELKCRKLQVVPHCYVRLVMGKDHSPLQLWRELGGAIRAAREETDMRPLLQWLQLAASRVVDEGTEDERLPPTHLGEEMTTFPALRSAALHRLRLNILREDFPEWTRQAGVPEKSGDLSDLYRLMRRDQERERAQRNAQRLSDKAPKKPSEKFPWATRRFLLICGVDAEEYLPKVYHDLAASAKGETRIVLQEHVKTRMREGKAAVSANVLITKEIHDMVIKGELGDEHSSDDLSKGLHPFTAGFGLGPHTERIQARVDAYDLAVTGDVNPTLSE